MDTTLFELTLVGVGALAGIATLVFAVVAWLIDQEAKYLKNQCHRADVLRMLVEEDAAWPSRVRNAYMKNLRGVLDWADQPDRLGVCRTGRLARWLRCSHGWTVRSYEFNLLLAVGYPITTMFVAWLLTGSNVSGIAKLFPDTTSGLERALLAVGWIVGGAFIISSVRRSGWQRTAFLGAGLGILVLGIFAGAGAFIVASTGASTGAFIVASTGAFIVAGAGAGRAAAIVSLTVTYTVVVAVAIGIPGADGIAFAVAVVFVVAVAVVVVIVHSWLAKRVRRAAFYTVHCLVFVVLSVMGLPPMFHLLEVGDVFGRLLTQLLVFLALLPLVNAVFDWLSLGLTRTLLRLVQGQRAANHPLRARLFALAALVDLVVALGFMVALALSATALLQTMNLLLPASATGAGFDLHTIFMAFCRPGIAWEYGWIYVTLFSTLIPTVVHLSLAVFALLLHGGSAAGRERWIELLKNNFNGRERERDRCARYLVTRRVRSVVLAIVLFLVLGVVFFGLFLEVGAYIVTWCRDVANLIGAGIPACDP